MKEIIINDRNVYSGKPLDDLNELAEYIESGKELWYKAMHGARTGTIAKVLHPEYLVAGGKWSGSLSRSGFEILLGSGKEIKVGVKAYNNDFHFLMDYDGGHIDSFQTGLPAKAKPTKTGQPDMLGNLISVGDWVIYTPHGKRAYKPGLGKLQRLSDAGGAWVMTTNKHGNEVEVRTDGTATLIKVHMTPELHTTYVLCDSLQGLRTKLIIDIDLD